MSGQCLRLVYCHAAGHLRFDIVETNGSCVRLFVGFARGKQVSLEAAIEIIHANDGIDDS